MTCYHPRWHSRTGYTLGRTHINSCDFSISSYSFDDHDGDATRCFSAFTARTCLHWEHKPHLGALDMRAGHSCKHFIIGADMLYHRIYKMNVNYGMTIPIFNSWPTTKNRWHEYDFKVMDGFIGQNCPVWGAWFNGSQWTSIATEEANLANRPAISPDLKIESPPCVSASLLYLYFHS